MKKLKPSTFVISITPFDKRGRIDEGAFRAHLQRLAASGIGIYVGGSGSGEGYTLSKKEMARVLEIAVKTLKGKAPVRAMGVEPRTAKQMIEFLKMAKAAGVDAAQIYSLDLGHGAAPQPEELAAYLDEVLGHSDLPAVISTHYSVGYKLPLPVLSDMLARYPHIAGINCTHPDLGYVAGTVACAAGRVPVHVGGPMQGLTILALGGQGHLSSEGNIAPKLCVSVIRHFEVGDMAAMMAAFGRLIKLFGALMEYGAGRVTKSALNRLGLPGGYPRRPRLPVTDTRLDKVMAVIDDLEIAKIEKW
ncbi:MAG: dihydrodipicolinate synthase family protein [Rhodospirillaceae bacterium]|nr:dihydrodipicolinate synthase family protein [Rhodospirillaceae bacterium]